jgi:hypothetical protein
VQWLEGRVAELIAEALPAPRRRALRKSRIAHVLIMAFDGFAIHRHLHPDESPIDDATINAVAAMLIGDAAPAPA